MQSSITLSSAEAKLVHMRTFAAEVIGRGSLAKDRGRDMKEVLHVSSAAIAISKRRENGKLRQINIGMLWIQETSENGEFVGKKVNGVSNPSCMSIKNINRDKTARYMRARRQRKVEGGT